MTTTTTVHGARSRARAYFDANPTATMTHDEFIAAFGFSTKECAKQTVYMLSMEGVAESVRMVRGCGRVTKPNDREVFQQELAILSPMELEMLVALAKGLKTYEIASQRGVAKSTAENHRQRILEKLNCSFAEACVTAAKAGYV